MGLIGWFRQGPFWLRYVFLSLSFCFLGVLSLSAKSPAYCEGQIKGLVRIPYLVPPPLALKAGDQISIPLINGVYLDPSSEAPTQRLLEVSADFMNGVRSVLVIGTGASPELVMIGRKHPEIPILHGIDLDPRAIENSQAAFRFNSLGEDRLKVWVSDGFQNVDRQYDLILFAAPRPIRFDEMEHRYGGLSAIRMWPRFLKRSDLFDPEGVLRSRMLKDLPRVLGPGGRFLLMSDADFEPEMPEGFSFTKHGRWNWSASGRDGFYTVYEIFRKTH